LKILLLIFPALLSAGTLYDTLSDGGVITGYRYLASEISKDVQMQFEVDIDLGGNILKVQIIDAGNEFGEKVNTKRFLKRFIGHNASSNLRKKIDGITGATYSSDAIIRGCEKALLPWKQSIKSK